MVKKAIYAGSFDPITRGHLWVIEQAVKLFDEVVVAIGVNPNKKSTFDLETRMDMIKESIAEQDWYPQFDFRNSQDGISVVAYNNQFLVNYARTENIKYLIRGIRTESDFEYEREMMHVNLSIDNTIQTIFLMPPKDISSVSSSMVRGFVGPAGWENVARNYVTEPVMKRLRTLNKE